MDPKTGGVAATIKNLLPELDLMNIRSEVVCFDTPVPTAVEQQEGFVLHRIGPSTGPWGRLPGFTQWLDLHAGNFDVVLLHGLWLYNNYAYTKWIRVRRSKSGIPVPQTWIMPHGMLDPWFQQSGGRRLKSLRNFVYWHLIEKKTIASADLLIFTSEAECNKAVHTFSGYKPKKTAIVQLGVPEPPGSLSAVSNQPIYHEFGNNGFLLALGRIDPKKGFDLLPEVWSRLQLNSHYRDRLPKLLIAGPGWHTPYGRKLKQLISDLALDKNIITNDMLESEDKWIALRSCEALIMPSHQENFGLVAAEALACGTPLLISNQVDIHSLIEAGGAGLSDVDSVIGMEHILRRWLDMSPEVKNKMRVNARNSFLEQFQIRQAASRFKHLLAEKGN